MNPPPASPRWATLAKAVATFVGMTVLLLFLRSERPGWLHLWARGPSRPELQELVAAAALEATRAAEGRLTGGFPYAPARSHLRGPQGGQASPDVRIAAANIERHAASRDSAADQAALGVAALTLGDTDKAVELLQVAVAQVPNHFAYESDLAAAYLTRAAWDDHPEDYPRALARADKAVKLNPRSAEALFNKVVALTRLHLPDEASQARREYLSLDADSGWAQELIADPSGLGTASPNGLSADLGAELLQALRAGDAVRVRQLAAVSIERARDYFELRLLGGWAAAVRQRDTPGADRVLKDMRLLADGIAAASGDRCSRDTVADISAAGHSPRIELIAEGIAAYLEGRRVYEADAVAQSKPHFDRAQTLLTQAGSPLRVWPAFYDCLQHYYTSPADIGRACFTHLNTVADADGDRLVAAHCQRMVGLLHSAESKQVEALRAYHVALAELEAAK